MHVERISVRKLEKNIQASQDSNLDLYDTSAVLYQLSQQANLCSCKKEA